MALHSRKAWYAFIENECKARRVENKSLAGADSSRPTSKAKMCGVEIEQSHDHKLLPIIHARLYSFRLSQSARVSCHIHSTQSDDEWWCNLDALRPTSCTRTHWTAGLRSPNKKVHVPSSRVHCPTFSVELEAPSSWSSTTNSRNSCKCKHLKHNNKQHPVNYLRKQRTKKIRAEKFIEHPKRNLCYNSKIISPSKEKPTLFSPAFNINGTHKQTPIKFLKFSVNIASEVIYWIKFD